MESIRGESNQHFSALSCQSDLWSRVRREPTSRMQTEAISIWTVVYLLKKLIS